jgi:hypothetical protein
VHAGIVRWLEMITGLHNLQHLQKAVLLGSVGILHEIIFLEIAMMVLVSQKQGLLPVLAKTLRTSRSC